MAHSRSSPFKKSNLFGPFLRDARKEKGWTQDHLAIQLQLAGWSATREVVAQIESGRRTLLDLELVLITRILGLGLDELLAKLGQSSREIAAWIPDRNKRWKSEEGG